jgi:hypothetical protein
MARRLPLEGSNVNLDGSIVQTVCVNFGVTLVFGSQQPDVRSIGTLGIDGEVAWGAVGSEVRVDVANCNRAELEPLLELHNQIVSWVTVTDDGDLELRLATGWHLVVRHAAYYEAWVLYDADGDFELGAVPGGGLHDAHYSGLNDRIEGS